MNNYLRWFTISIAAAATTGCSPSYEFRSDDRPTYENTVTVEELVELKKQGAVVVDVRLIEDFQAEPTLIPDAMYRDPENIEAWSASMSPKDQTVIVYCVKGKWVSQKAANYLQDQGYNVFSLEGGIEAWKSANRDTFSPAH